MTTCLFSIREFSILVPISWKMLGAPQPGGQQATASRVSLPVLSLNSSHKIATPSNSRFCLLLAWGQKQVLHHHIYFDPSSSLCTHQWPLLYHQLNYQAMFKRFINQWYLRDTYINQWNTMCPLHFMLSIQFGLIISQKPDLGVYLTIV